MTKPPASLNIASQARQASVPTLMDMETVNPDTLALLRNVDTAIVPLPVAAEISESDDKRRMLKTLTDFGPSRVAITMGENGAVGVDAEGNEFAISPAPCRVVDTTGAGDAFHAGFLFADAKGVAFPRALDFAAKVASLKCETAGPSVGTEALEPFRF